MTSDAARLSDGGSAILVKLGGSLITWKDRPDSARRGTIDRLAFELSEVWPELEVGIVLGHGSGSFGHTAARKYGLEGEGSAPGAGGSAPEPKRSEGMPRSEAEAARAASVTQAKAAELHAIVMAALRAAGLPVFSIAPGSAALTASGRPQAFQAEPFAIALSRSLLPVTYGDVVMDREKGASILSTETVFAELVASLPALGWAVDRTVWLGETNGIYDADGNTVSPISRSDAEELGQAVGGSAAADVTGGMTHRLNTALDLADRGVRSWIGDGGVEGTLTRALRGEEVGGTVVPVTG